MLAFLHKRSSLSVYFLAFLKVLLICDFNFWHISPPEYMFKRWFKSLFSQFQRKKNSLIRAKNVVFFLIQHFGWQANGEGYSPPSWLRYWLSDT